MPVVKNWEIREAEASELNFIYATWLNSYRYDSFTGKACKNTVFFAEYPKIIDFILDKPLTKVIVAYFPESPTVILSYLVYEPSTIHYIFTKEFYQKNGIAMSLIWHAFEKKIDGGMQFSHRTLQVEPILQKYQAKLQFNPFSLYQKPNLERETHE